MDEVCKYTPRELDFVLEGQSAERVAKDLQHRVDIHIPAVLWEYTARRVLVTEFVQEFSPPFSSGGLVPIPFG